MLIFKLTRMRPPDLTIGDDDNPYLLRWYVIPKNPVFNIYLHRFCRSDDDRALHDHPWLFNASILIQGRYIEVVPMRRRTYGRIIPPGIRDLRERIILRERGGVYFRFGKAPHRVKLYEDNDRPRHVWTIFITGPKLREWGFYCSWGWRHWREFVSVREKGNAVGRGCE